MKKVTLQLSDGRKLVFSGVENISISEETTMKSPQEGEWFRVNPLTIDQNLFKKERKNSEQEVTRKLILEAFEEMKKNSEYAKPFKTMMPEKTWSEKTVRELKALASKLGDHNADWVEQALEWAQRIANGETWKSVCNDPDTANWYRLVVWKSGFARRVGGSRWRAYVSPASGVGSGDCVGSSGCVDTVPLVVLYEKTFPL